MTAAGQKIAEWAASPFSSRQLAASLGTEMTAREAGGLVESREKISLRYGVRPSTAQRALRLLQGAGIVRKSGRHLYVAGDYRETGD